MKLKWLAMALMATMTWACSEDETSAPEQEPEKKVLVVEVPAEPKLPEANVWLIISDANGSVLDTALLKNGKNYTFEASSDFADDVVSLTITWSFASYPEDPGKREMYVRTYADIPFGKFQYPKVQSPVEWSQEPEDSDPVSTLKITGAFARGWNVEEMLCFPEGSHTYQYNAFPASDAVRIDIQASKSALLVAYLSKLPFNYWYQVSEGEEIHTISANDFLVAETKTVEVPQGNNIRCTVFGKNQFGRFRYFAAYQAGSLTSVDLPVPAGLFQSYETSIEIQKSEGIYSYTSNDTQIPDRARFINGTLDITLQDNAIVADVNAASGESDILIFDATSADGGYLRWWVYATPGKRTIIPPQLPDFIPLGDGETARSFTTLAEHNGFAQSLRESSAHQGYYDYLTNYELVGQHPLPKDLLTLEKYTR